MSIDLNDRYQCITMNVKATEALKAALCFREGVFKTQHKCLIHAVSNGSHSICDTDWETRLSHGMRLGGVLSPSLNNPMLLIIHIYTTQHNERRPVGCSRLWVISVFLLRTLPVIS